MHVYKSYATSLWKFNWGLFNGSPTLFLEFLLNSRGHVLYYMVDRMDTSVVSHLLDYQAPVTKYSRLGNVQTTEMYRSPIWRWEVQQIWCLVRCHSSLVAPALCAHLGEGTGQTPLGHFYKTLVLHLTNLQRPPLIPHWGLASMYTLWGDTSNLTTAIAKGSGLLSTLTQPALCLSPSDEIQALHQLWIPSGWPSSHGKYIVVSMPLSASWFHKLA